MSHLIHKKSLGKLTSLNKNPTAERTNKEDGRSFGKPGHSGGVAFYHKAVQFFKKVQTDERFKDMV